jgi:uncharacterized protein
MMRRGAIGERLAWLACVCAAIPLAASTPAPDLVKAAKAGDHGAARQLLARHEDVNATEADGTAALHWAASTNDLEMTELLVHAGAQVNVANRYGVSPLSLAAGNGDAPIVNALLRAGAQVGFADRSLTDGRTVLMLAARSGSVEAVQALLEHGAAVNAAESRTGTTALMWAAAADQPFVVRALLKAGAEMNARSAIPKFPHTPPAVIGDPLEADESYAGQTPLPKGGWTALMYAARQNAQAAAQALAEAGADLNVADPDGTSALEIAIINGHFDLAALLLDKGADPNLADRTGMTPLYAAVDMHTLAETFGRPDLPRPVMEASIGAIRNLLAHGADPNARLKSKVLKRVYNPGDPKLGEGATAFMRAARGADPVVMRMLLEAGADPTLAQKNRNTPIILAAGVHVKSGDNNPLRGTEANVIEAIQICLDRGMDVNAANGTGETAIFAAIGSPEVIRFLVNHGARLDIQNRRGQTPLEAALKGRDAGDPSVAMLRQLAAGAR